MAGLAKYLKRREGEADVYEVDILNASDADLEAVSEAAGIGLSLPEMKTVQAHFQGLGRNPTDIELESLGQAWSEHCCYKSSKPVLREHVYGIHEERLVAREDAGVMPFTDTHHYVVKIESHNHPSAIEPYGGAATGIGGVLRDVACMGAQPIALVDPLFFGPLDMRHRDLPPGTKHPRYLLGGVVAGIRDYGNRVGIPTIAGGVHFHPKFLTNCLVNVGCIGVMPKDKLIHSRVGGVGDVFILLGGRTGRDGIHGVTFASADLTEDAEETSRSAVQLGDPITKEPLIHVSLELNDRGLITGMKDLGGGGLSCVSGEMALDAGLGAVIDLETVPTKAPDLKPWEVWVSESQERMMVTARPEMVAKVLAVARKWDVLATVVGEVIDEKKVKVRWNGIPILEMESEFLYGGPEWERPAEQPERPTVHAPPADLPEDLTDLFLQLIERPNIASRDLIIRQYDHEVRGNTAVKPLQGKLGHQSHGDASVLKPVADSWKGLAVTVDASPTMTDVDPYHGTASSMDEMVRNLAAVGARLDSIADNLNFPNPERPHGMWAINEAARALGDGAKALGVPFVSGNVSMYNESAYAPIPPTPTLLGVGIVEDIRTCVTTDVKREGASLFQVGNTRDEMGGSEWYGLAGGESTAVPTVDWARTKQHAEAVVTAIEKGLVAACHDVSQGGLAVAVAEMCFGGDVGATIDVQGPYVGFADDVLLFGESNTRWVLESLDDEALAAHFSRHGVPLHKLGAVGGDRLVMKSGGRVRVDAGLGEARARWDDALHKYMAG